MMAARFKGTPYWCSWEREKKEHEDAKLLKVRILNGEEEEEEGKEKLYTNVTECGTHSVY